MYNIFCEETEHYQDFWETMDELDSRCWVLEPENPSRRDTYRKISIGMLLDFSVCRSRHYN
jgi:E3 ubiquitin-protein ligase FANCL